MSQFTIALAGNPNSGKTTLFNTLTGSKQRIGNWPGVTVERVEGSFNIEDSQIDVIDLPGIYSFSAYSLDEKVSREFILNDKPDLVVNIIDATNLERNLYLTTQLLEMRVPMLVVLNMMDLVEQRKIKIEIQHLATHLDCPIIDMCANKKQGIDKLKYAINDALKTKNIPSAQVQYDSILEEQLQRILPEVDDTAKKNKVNKRWLAIKLLEHDELADKLTENKLQHLIDDISEKIEKHTGDPADIVVADGRYGFIHGLAKDVINRDAQVTHTITDNIDKIALHKIVGIPLFLLSMYIVFMITMNISGPFTAFFDSICQTIFVDGTKDLIGNAFPVWVTTLLADGIGGGIQTVATFIPPIFLIFMCLSFLEDSGYMARAAFVMDRLLRSIGLPGKAFIPMLVGLGCNVPGIMATRTLENPRDRILSVMINPLISCGARLPIYALFASVFFPQHAGTLLFCIYFTGISLAVISGLLFGKTILKGDAATFVMELPPYHMPTFSGVMYHTWSRLKSFLIRAGQVIIIVIVILSFLNSLGNDGTFGNEGTDKSILTSIGKSITPIFSPMGISQDNWPATVGLFTGIFAKEVVVGSLNALYTTEKNKNMPKETFDFWKEIAKSFNQIPKGFHKLTGSFFDPLGAEEMINSIDNKKDISEILNVNKDIHKVMKSKFQSKSAAIAYLLFILIYMPCVAATAAIFRETGWKWGIFSVSYLTGLAWIISTLFYQTTQLTQNPKTALGWITICIAIIAIFVSILKVISSNKINNTHTKNNTIT
jgi:ferrous iron transport protein B